MDIKSEIETLYRKLKKTALSFPSQMEMMLHIQLRNGDHISFEQGASVAVYEVTSSKRDELGRFHVKLRRISQKGLH